MNNKFLSHIIETDILKIKKIMSTLFYLPIESINFETKKSHIAQWDSLHQMNLLLALEEEFNITLTDEDVVRMNSFVAIVEIVQKHRTKII